MLEILDHSDPVTLRLSGELTIQQAEPLKTGLLDALERGKDLQVDLSGVSELDSSGVQLLHYAKQAARQQGLAFELIQHSPAVVEVFELYRLAPLFGDPMLLESSERIEPTATASHQSGAAR